MKLLCFYTYSLRDVIHVKLEPRRSPLFILQAIKAGDKAGDEARDAGYQELFLDSIQIPTLENWGLLFFKIIHNLMYFPSTYLPSPLSSARCNHAHRYSIPYAQTNRPLYPIVLHFGTTCHMK